MNLEESIRRIIREETDQDDYMEKVNKKITLVKKFMRSFFPDFNRQGTEVTKFGRPMGTTNLYTYRDMDDGSLYAKYVQIDTERMLGATAYRTYANQSDTFFAKTFTGVPTGTTPDEAPLRIRFAVKFARHTFTTSPTGPEDKSDVAITTDQVLSGAGTVGQYIRGDGSLACQSTASRLRTERPFNHLHRRYCCYYRKYFNNSCINYS